MNLSKDWLGKSVEVIVDRPLSSKHPKYGFEYPLNYGYLPNTLSGDGMEIDAYILKEGKVLSRFFGKIVAIIHRQDDLEDKLIVIAENKTITDKEILAAIEFQEKYFDSVIFR